VLHVPSNKQFANVFTKGLPSALHEDFKTSLCVGPIRRRGWGGVLDCTHMHVTADALPQRIERFSRPRRGRYAAYGTDDPAPTSARSPRALRARQERTPPTNSLETSSFS
jgi:hypothetical protein